MNPVRYLIHWFGFGHDQDAYEYYKKRADEALKQVIAGEGDLDSFYRANELACAAREGCL